MFAVAMSPRLRMQNRNAEPKWRQICRLPETQTRVYFNLSNRGIHRLAIERAFFHRQGVSLSPFYSHNTVDYFYFAAALEGVVQVTPCRRELATYSPIIGLLLCYVDGRRTCVGEFRMDGIDQTLEVDDPSQGLHLGFGRAEKVPPHLARLELRPTRLKGSLRWLSLEWKGLLEWLFAYGHCKVYYEGQESPSL